MTTTSRSRGHSFWDGGATPQWKRLSLDLRYGGTGEAPRNCYITRWCEPGPAAALTYRVYSCLAVQGGACGSSASSGTISTPPAVGWAP